MPVDLLYKFFIQQGGNEIVATCANVDHVVLTIQKEELDYKIMEPFTEQDLVWLLSSTT